MATSRLITAALAAIAGLASGLAAAQPEIHHWETDSGAGVYYVHAPELPMVDLQVTFAAGSARDGDQPGLATLTAGLLESGAGDRGEEAMARDLAAVGAELSTSADRDRASVHLRSLSDSERLDPALAILADAVGEPNFPENAFERERQRMLVGLRQAKQDPGQVADRAFHRAVYGDHPYAHHPKGTVESVEGLARSDVMAFHDRYYTAANADVAIVGDVDRERAEELAEAAVARLPDGEAAPSLPEVPEMSGSEEVHEDFPSAQTHLLIGQPGMRRGDPDYWPLLVGNHVLGGSGFGSRIMEAVREERGLAYSAYSYFQPLARRGPFTIGLQTANANAAEAEELVHDLLADFVDEGPTEEELEAAKANLVGSFPLRIDTNSDLLGYLAMIGFHDLPTDYLERFRERVESVTAEEIRDAFRRRVDPDRLVTVTVGGDE
ncbi:MAG: M16 family metallopeptidase [Pseudomonadota bacterium]